MSEIKHEYSEKGGAFVYYLGELKMAEMVYVKVNDRKIIIDHTEVDPSLKGKGVGKELLWELVQWVRLNEIKVIPLCPFAHATFNRMKEWQDVLE